jgi:hypothetical protein
MVVVSGTGRSGTSMWMQILKTAGLEIIGEKFPKNWESTLSKANPQGFYESSLLQGINFMTNPDPNTGEKIDPVIHRNFAVKVFSFGLRSTDRSYLGRTLFSLRDWRGFSESLERMSNLSPNSGIPNQLELDSTIFHPAWWFCEVYDTLLDSAQRNYNILWTTFESAINSPSKAIERVCGRLQIEVDLGTCAAVINKRLVNSVPNSENLDLPNNWIKAFDDLYNCIHQSCPINAALYNELRAVRLQIADRFLEY